MPIILFVPALLACGVCAFANDGGSFEYPCYVVNAHDADRDGFCGMDPNGSWWPHVSTDPNVWLVGQPPSDKSAVTLPPDHWVELQFRGPIVDGPGYDIEILERGRVGEEALIFLTNGRGREYLYDLIRADDDTGNEPPSRIQLDIAGVVLPFAPRAIRIVGLDKGGQSPGFDLMNVTARISTACGGHAACNPIPVDSARGVAPDAQLSWSPGSSAQRHIVYFGSSPDDAGPDAEPVSVPSQGQDANSFDPGPLELNTTYYWRVDEVNGVSPQDPHTGEIWSFRTARGLVIDDFERYNTDETEVAPQLGSWWIEPLYEVDAVLNANKDLAHGEGRSMLLAYDIEGSYVAEVSRVFEEPQDWARAGIEVLELYFRGTADNGTAVEMYLSLFDGQVTAKVPYGGSPNDLTVEQWQRWAVDLDEFSGVNLSNIEKLVIGFTDADPGSWVDDFGELYVDDVGVYPVRCVEELEPEGDCTNDCVVDYRDVDLMADVWLTTGRNVYPVAVPNAPVLWYQFEGNLKDSGPQGRDGQIVGYPDFVPGFYGQGIRLDGDDDGVNVVGARYMFGAMSDAITIAFWQQGNNSTHDRDTLCCSDYEYGIKNPAVAVNFGCWKRPGRYFWHCGSEWAFDNQIEGRHEGSREWTGRWNHWAFTKDINAGDDPNRGEMKVFLNGVLVDSRSDVNEPIDNVQSFTVGTGWYGGYDGVIDEFRIYDYALSAGEIAFVATNGTGVFDLPLLSPIDLIPDNAINFKDFAVLADHWLESGLPVDTDSN